ncbi:uncharacterized protein ASPGLDRAFT_53312, partial [Aspergillus glaucus CBS 516.65]
MAGDPHLLSQVDAKTVQQLQSRVPKISKLDREHIEKGFHNGSLFPLIINANHREELLDRLKMVSVPIPSLRTFFQDILYLCIAKNVMKTLERLDLAPRQKPTIDEGVKGGYRWTQGLHAPQQHEVQYHLLELWRFSFQYGCEMVGTNRLVRNTKGQSDSVTWDLQYASPDRKSLWKHFFWLANHYGFTVPNDSPVERLEIECTPGDHPEELGSDEPLSRRSGKPFADSVDADRFALSSLGLQRQWKDDQGVTLGLVRGWMFRAFFSHLIPANDNRPILVGKR